MRWPRNRVFSAEDDHEVFTSRLNVHLHRYLVSLAKWRMTYISSKILLIPCQRLCAHKGGNRLSQRIIPFHRVLQCASLRRFITCVENVVRISRNYLQLNKSEGRMVNHIKTPRYRGIPHLSRNHKHHEHPPKYKSIQQMGDCRPCSTNHFIQHKRPPIDSK
jgi:hypothetical protein